jgi:hypothetical protein
MRSFFRNSILDLDQIRKRWMLLSPFMFGLSEFQQSQQSIVVYTRKVNINHINFE